MRKGLTEEEKSIASCLATIGSQVLPLTISTPDQFLHLYESLPGKKSPLFDSNLKEHADSKWSFFSLRTETNLPKFECTPFNGQIDLAYKELFAWVDKMLQTKKPPLLLEEFPFIGGLIGYFSYENFSNHHSQCLQAKNNFPLFSFAMYANAFLFDHHREKSYLICNHEQTPYQLYQTYSQQTKVKSTITKQTDPLLLIQKTNKNEYFQKLETIFEHIRNGDIYQANFTHKFVGKYEGQPFELYKKLRKFNPAPFSSFAEINHNQFILCSSPERLFNVKNGCIRSYPIKGTIRRDAIPEVDQRLKETLLNSPKDEAELTMIVDLVRNDLGKICEFSTIKVQQFKKLESFQRVHHLIAEVEGKLHKNTNIQDIFEAIFPGGSITGAPKIRSMEILRQLEEEERGPYTGSLGYIDIRGNIDFNIMIRTMLLDQQQLSLQVGGGIVIDSSPLCEYEESLLKAQALFDALQ